MDNERAHYIVGVDVCITMARSVEKHIADFHNQVAELRKEPSDENEQKIQQLEAQLRYDIGDTYLENIRFIRFSMEYLANNDLLFESKTQRLIHNAFFYAISGITGGLLFFATKYFF